MKGNPNTSAATFGTMGIANVSTSPGSQNNGITWTDAAGNLWLYGGQGNAVGGFGYLSDLWKYVPSTNNWTWIAGPGSISQAAVYGTMGVASSSNTPGARAGGASWVDNSGNLWLFGGINSTGPHNDLWRFTVATGQWTWMGGTTVANASPVYAPLTVGSSTAIPRASYNLISWKDPLGNFWLYDAMYGNEVWRYNTTNTLWAHMSGTSTAAVISGSILSTYGTQGVFSPTVFPGERYTEGVCDGLGNLYVFGGKVYTSTGFGRANDLWKYSIYSNQWAWLGGTQSTSSSGSYGTQGVFSSTAIPAGRYGHVMWADNLNNRIWLFSGEFQTLSNTNWVNDTWCYNVANNQWAWMKGSSTFYNLTSPGPGAVYGIQTIPGQNNTPGWRVNGTYWPNDVGTLWLFSGSEWNSSTELWKFGFCYTAVTLSVSSNPTSICGGGTATLSAAGSGTTFLWNTGAQTSSVVVSPTVGTIYTVTSSYSNCATTTTVSIPTSSIGISLQNAAPLCSGSTFSLSANASGSYTWSSGQNTASITVSPTTSAVYQLTANVNSCILTASYALNVSPIPTLVTNFSASSLCVGQSTAITCSGASTYSWSTSQNGPVISVAPVSNMVYTVVGVAASGCSASAQVSVDVYNPPTLAVALSSGTVCAGNSVTLTASGAASYSWSSGQSSSSIQVSPMSSTVYTVIGTTNSCTNIAVIAVQVQAQPTVAIVGASTAICAGQTLQLVASGAGTYHWSTGATGTSLTVSPTTTTVYAVIGTANSCSATGVFSLQVQAQPSLTIVSSNSAICAGQSAQLVASGAGTYLWSGGATGASISISPTSTTVYSVTGTLNLCSSSATISQVVNPVPSLTLTASDLSICAGETTTLSAAGAISYSWNSLPVNSSTIMVAPLSTGIYTLVAANIHDCINSAAITINVSACTDISEQTVEDLAWSIFPNPNNSSFVVRAGENKILSVYSSTGQLVLERRLDANEVLIETALPAGVYFCCVRGLNNLIKLVVY